MEYGFHNGLAAPAFGKRTTPPAKPFWKVWASKLGRSHVAILSEPDAYQARMVYADHHGIDVSDVCAELMLPSR